jgi:hypothetical protein
MLVTKNVMSLALGGDADCMPIPVQPASIITLAAASHVCPLMLCIMISSSVSNAILLEPRPRNARLVQRWRAARDHSYGNE